MMTAAAAVTRHTEDTDMALDDAPGSPAVLNRLWRDVRQWVTVRLEAGQTPQEIVAHAKRVFHVNPPPGWEPLSALRLDADSVVFGMRDAPLGTVFILHRSGPHTFTTAMDMGNPRTWGRAWARDLAEWRPRNATESAQAGAQSGELHPLSPIELVRLPNEVDGAARFAIVGNYAQIAGATRGY